MIRQGQDKTVTLTLGTLPAEKQAAKDTNQREIPDSEMPKLGLTLAPGSKVSGAGGNGVVVTAVEQGGVAADHGFQVGDVILDVGGKPVTTPADVRKSLADASTAGKHTVSVSGEVGRRHEIRRAAARQRLRKRGDPLASVAPAGGRTLGTGRKTRPRRYQLCLPASVAPAGVE